MPYVLRSVNVYVLEEAGEGPLLPFKCETKSVLVTLLNGDHEKHVFNIQSHSKFRI